ncbi:hypothetical protein TGP89_311730 [Toxoplasma gondii p89]|uniref:Metallo-beta-lactamase domain-containing protein n=1 Tax=Toxoplasma gondii p89 TaxID=943119 RepID=A0A086J943_TOXGO|nr:hypothetical protein TGP89_311730 [Toxoplasma gondii p89]
MPVPGPLPFTTIFVDFFRLPFDLRRRTANPDAAKGAPTSEAEVSKSSAVLPAPLSSSSPPIGPFNPRPPSSSLFARPFVSSWSASTSCASSRPSSLPFSSALSSRPCESGSPPPSPLSSHSKGERGNKQFEEREGKTHAYRGSSEDGQGPGEDDEEGRDRHIHQGRDSPQGTSGPSVDGKRISGGLGIEDEGIGGNEEFHFYSDNPWVFLLSHLHTDHISGLHGRWQEGRIFCSPTTRRLLLLRFPNLASRVAALGLHRVYSFFFHSGESRKANTDAALEADRGSSLHVCGGGRWKGGAGVPRRDGEDSCAFPAIQTPHAEGPVSDENEIEFSREAKLDLDETNEASRGRGGGSEGVEKTAHGESEGHFKRPDGCRTHEDAIRVRLMLLDAHHCPGAVLFVLQSPAFGVYVHTGDLNCNPDTVDKIIRDIKGAIHAFRCREGNVPRLCSLTSSGDSENESLFFLHDGKGNDAQLVLEKTVFRPDGKSRGPPSMQGSPTSSPSSHSSAAVSSSSRSSSSLPPSVSGLSVKAFQEKRGEASNVCGSSSLSEHVDHLFLDNTYLHPVFDFSASQDSFCRLVSSIRSILCIVSSRGTAHNRQTRRTFPTDLPSPADFSSPVSSSSSSSSSSPCLWLLVGTDSLGKEDMLVSLSQKLGVPIGVSVARFEAMKVYVEPAVLSAHFRRGLPTDLEKALACQTLTFPPQRSTRTACEARPLPVQALSRDAESTPRVSTAQTGLWGCCPCSPCLVCPSCQAAETPQRQGKCDRTATEEELRKAGRKKTRTDGGGIREGERSGSGGEGGSASGEEEGEEREGDMEDEGEEGGAPEGEEQRQLSDEDGTNVPLQKGEQKWKKDRKTEGHRLQVFGVSRHLLRRSVTCLHNQWKSAAYRHRSAARHRRREVGNEHQADEEILSRTVVGVFCSGWTSRSAQQDAPASLKFLYHRSSHSAEDENEPLFLSLLHSSHSDFFHLCRLTLALQPETVSLLSPVPCPYTRERRLSMRARFASHATVDPGCSAAHSRFPFLGPSTNVNSSMSNSSPAYSQSSSLPLAPSGSRSLQLIGGCELSETPNRSRLELATSLPEREVAGSLALTVGDLIMEDEFLQELTQEAQESASPSRGEVSLMASSSGEKVTFEMPNSSPFHFYPSSPPSSLPLPVPSPLGFSSPSPSSTSRPLASSSSSSSLPASGLSPSSSSSLSFSSDSSSRNVSVSSSSRYSSSSSPLYSSSSNGGAQLKAYDGDEGLQLFMEVCGVPSVFLAAGRACTSSYGSRQKGRPLCSSRSRALAARQRPRGSGQEADLFLCPRHGALAAKQHELLDREGGAAPLPRAFVHCIETETTLPFRSAGDRDSESKHTCALTRQEATFLDSPPETRAWSEDRRRRVRTENGVEVAIGERSGGDASVGCLDTSAAGLGKKAKTKEFPSEGFLVSSFFMNTKQQCREMRGARRKEPSVCQAFTGSLSEQKENSALWNAKSFATLSASRGEAEEDVLCEEEHVQLLSVVRKQDVKERGQTGRDEKESNEKEREEGRETGKGSRSVVPPRKFVSRPVQGKGLLRKK